MRVVRSESLSRQEREGLEVREAGGEKQAEKFIDLSEITTPSQRLSEVFLPRV
jgi:hypothetical protein